MYSPAVIISPTFSFEKKEKQRSIWALMSPTILYSFRSVYIMRVYVVKVLNKFCFLRSFSPQYHSQVITNFLSESVSQVRNKKSKTRSLICKVILKFLSSSKNFSCDTAFAVVVFFLNESVHRFNINCNRTLTTLTISCRKKNMKRRERAKSLFRERNSISF